MYYISVVRFIFIATLTSAAEGLEVGRCRVALGMQTKEIPDHAIKASSSLNHSNLGPASARVRTEINGGAWCPKEHVSENVYEYLQIDFGELKVITLVETQGRFGNGQGQEYVEQYTLEYQRETGKNWLKFVNRRGQKIFQGNMNTYIAELREVDPPIIAQSIRFVPYSERPKAACLRVEVYGCAWKDGVLWYNMPQGERRSAELEFMDVTYDGAVEGNYLSGGLGQLMDGDVGQSNFRQDSKNFGIKGYEWVGWKNDSFADGLVEIIFKFDVRRNFTLMSIHCNNLFSKEVRIFRSAHLSFSDSEKLFPAHSVDYTQARDVATEQARSVIIPMENGIGRYVKLELYFDSRWMMISEIHFESEHVKEEVDLSQSSQMTTDDGPPLLTAAAADATVFHSFIEVVDVIFERKDETITRESSLHSLFSQATTRLPDTMPLSDLQSEKILNTSITVKKLNDEYVGIIIGTLLVVAVILVAVILLLLMRHRRQKYTNGHQVIKCVEPRHVAVTMNSLRHSRATLSNGKISNGNIYDFVATSDVDSDQARSCCGGITNMVEFYPEMPPEQICHLSELPRASDASGGFCSCHPLKTIQRGQCGAGQRQFQLPGYPASVMKKDYSAKHILEMPLPVNLSNSPVNNSWLNMHLSSLNSEFVPFQGTLLRPPLHPTGSIAFHHLPYGPAQYLAASTTAYRECLDSSRTSTNGLSSGGLKDFSVIEFPQENLQLVRKLGDWQFGEVHLCDTVLTKSFVKADALLASRALLLIVKMMRTPADDQMRMEFRKEFQIMSQISDANILQLIGTCFSDEPMCLIYEHLKYGDLKKFLQQHTIDCSSERTESSALLSYGTLIYMASQIASGMKHLEMLNIVHRDLAARNCLVGESYTVKVSDLGISRSIYRDDYCVIDDKILLPIRWMSWESLILNKSSCKSDVWSFGVTMWEILSLARQRPFADLTDRQVLDNHSHFYSGYGRQMCPLQPGPSCPREIYDLMRECWNRDEASRPTFREMHMFLQRKNMGYNAEQEETRLQAAGSVFVC